MAAAHNGTSAAATAHERALTIPDGHTQHDSLPKPLPCREEMGTTRSNDVFSCCNSMGTARGGIITSLLAKSKCEYRLRRISSTAMQRKLNECGRNCGHQPTHGQCGDQRNTTYMFHTAVVPPPSPRITKATPAWTRAACVT